MNSDFNWETLDPATLAASQAQERTFALVVFGTVGVGDTYLGFMAAGKAMFGGDGL